MLDLMMLKDSMRLRSQKTSLTAERTYDEGDKLERSINSYMNTMQSLPQFSRFVYPNIEYLLELSF